MIILLSPAKTLDFENSAQHQVCTQAEFLDLTQNLISGLKNLSASDLIKLMGISPKLAELNLQRFQSWQVNHENENSKQAILAFKGDVYEGLQAWDFNKNDFKFAQKHLRILSGLYGLLRPLDLIQAHRLEMGTLYPNPAGKDLYSFWGDRLAEAINSSLKESKSKLLINLASQEYFKAVREELIQSNVISPVFKDEKNGNFKIISFYAKKARGYMSSYLIRNRVKDINGLLAFNEKGYIFSDKDSTPRNPRIHSYREEKIGSLNCSKTSTVKIYIFIIFCFSYLLSAVENQSKQPFSVVAYNLENLFDIDGYSLYEDYKPAFYGELELKNKLDAIVKVLRKIGGRSGPDILLLQEVEVDRTPNQQKSATDLLMQCLAREGLGPYNFSIGYNPKDNPENWPAVQCLTLSKFPIIKSRLLSLQKARPILETTLSIDGERFTIFNNHWKSGASSEAMEKIRYQNASVLRKRIDELLELDPFHDFIVGGDLNSHYNQTILYAPQMRSSGINDILLSSNIEPIKPSPSILFIIYGMSCLLVRGGPMPGEEMGHLNAHPSTCRAL